MRHCELWVICLLRHCELWVVGNKNRIWIKSKFFQLSSYSPFAASPEDLANRIQTPRDRWDWTERTDETSVSKCIVSRYFLNNSMLKVFVAVTAAQNRATLIYLYSSSLWGSFTQPTINNIRFGTYQSFCKGSPQYEKTSRKGLTVAIISFWYFGYLCILITQTHTLKYTRERYAKKQLERQIKTWFINVIFVIFQPKESII